MLRSDVALAKALARKIHTTPRPRYFKGDDSAELKVRNGQLGIRDGKLWWFLSAHEGDQKRYVSMHIDWLKPHCRTTACGPLEVLFQEVPMDLWETVVKDAMRKSCPGAKVMDAMYLVKIKGVRGKRV